MAEPGVIFDVNGAFYPLRKFNVSSSEGLVKGDEEHAVPDFVSDWPTGLTPSRGGRNLCHGRTAVGVARFLPRAGCASGHPFRSGSGS
jgi:hypothetical protein